MSYIDRIERLTYQSPKRKTFDLEFDDLARNIQRKTAINEFPYQNIANVQDLGMGNLKIPIRCYISGNDYDLEADRFFKALNEQGSGILDHPRWGSIDVIPINITQSESFIDGLGRAIFEIEFVEFFPNANNFPEKIYTFFKKVRRFCARGFAPQPRLKITVG
jgi:prophage DNA circulation protein